MSEPPAFTPVVLLTGFLGSGKTTLLARLLKRPDLGDSAVLINEFGAVGLDHQLVEAIDETIVLLGSGCVCCTVRGELAAAIRDLHSKRVRGVVPPFRRLVIETTGLADPTPALSTITADPVLRHHFRVGGVIAAVDAVNIADQLARYPESVKQVAVADRLVLTKADLVTPDALPAVAAALRTVNPDAPLVDAATADLATLLERPGATAFAGLRCEPVAADGRADAPAHGDTRSVSLAFEGALDWTLFGLWLTMLLNRHGQQVLRVKGLLNVAGSDTPVAVHGVQQLVHVPTHLDDWPDADRRSRLVFILRGLDPALIERSMAAFGLVRALAPLAAAG